MTVVALVAAMVAEIMQPFAVVLAEYGPFAPHKLDS
jgi:hypothetical protein